MAVLLQHLWLALAAAFALGFGFTALFGGGARLPSTRWEVRAGALLLLAAGLLVSALALVPGRPGLWLDIAIFCALAYALGTGCGAGLRYLVGRLHYTSPG